MQMKKRQCNNVNETRGDLSLQKQTITIDTDYITLGQLLKVTNLFDSGGMIKTYIREEGVLVNDERDYRRGRKLYNGDIVYLDSDNIFLVKKK